MEEWIPLFNILLNSPTPESEASLWLQHSFTTSSDPTITYTSFLALLTKPTDAIIAYSSSPSDAHHRIMWMETMPNLVQARILSSLAYDCRSFSSLELFKLAASLLSREKEVDFWVRSGARNLLDKLSERTQEVNYGEEVHSVCNSVENEFYSLPTWMEDSGISHLDGSDPVLPWLPFSFNGLKLGMVRDSYANSEHSCMESEKINERLEEIDENNLDENQVVTIDLDAMDDSLDPDLQRIAADLHAKVLHFEGNLDTLKLANEIRQLCLGRSKSDTLSLLELIEPWQTDDEIIAVLLSNLLNGNSKEDAEELNWPSQVLCSTLLPKLLVLQEPASRILMTTTIEYCKLHQRAAEYALLFPLILRKEGINNPICDLLTRIMKECLNPAHITAFWQKMLSGVADVRSCICLPCHQSMVSSELLWTEATFSLLQNILNNNVHLTEDSIDHLVLKVHELAERFSRSLKFCNFLLCFVVKCFPLLKPHKKLLTGAAVCTNTIVSKSILSKLDCL
ncbi:hypothetical protein V2J09_012340 [Rumex salicifolius]